MDKQDDGGGAGGLSNDGYTVDTVSLAQRVGELRAVATCVGDLANSLTLNGSDIGPADLGAAVTEFADELYDGLSGFTEKVDVIADRVRDSVDTYDYIEEHTASEMIRLADTQTANELISGLEQQSLTLLTQREALMMPEPEPAPLRITNPIVDEGY